MTDSRRFRFSTNVFGLTSRAEFVGFAQRVEALVYATLFAADHLGSYAPFQMVVAAAQATSRMRLGTLSLDSATGAITGTPTETGLFTFQLVVADRANGAQ